MTIERHYDLSMQQAAGLTDPRHMSPLNAESRNTAADQAAPRWHLAFASDGSYGRGDHAASDQLALLMAGYEPFGIGVGKIWFRLFGP